MKITRKQLKNIIKESLLIEYKEDLLVKMGTKFFNADKSELERLMQDVAKMNFHTPGSPRFDDLLKKYKKKSDEVGRGIGILLEKDNFVEFNLEPKGGRTYKLFTIYLEPDENEDGTVNYLFDPFPTGIEYTEFVKFINEHLKDNAKKYFGIDSEPCMHNYVATSYGYKKPIRTEFFITTETKKVLPGTPDSDYEFKYSELGCPPNFG